MNASAGDARAARLLSDVLDARRRLEEDAEEALLRPGDTVSRATAAADGMSVSGLRERLQEAVAVAEVWGFGCCAVLACCCSSQISSVVHTKNGEPVVATTRNAAREIKQK